MTKNKKKKTDQKQRARTKSNRGALWILAAIFVLSAGVRLASGTGAAIAKEMSELTHADLKKENVQGASCTSTEETAALMTALIARELKVEEQELLLAQKWKAVEIARQEINENLRALEAAETRLEATMARSQTAAEDDLAKLTAVYEAMKPKEAAALFEAMSPEFAAGFLGRMRSDSAGAIMAGLKPETAYTISVLLAGRNANAPRE